MRPTPQRSPHTLGLVMAAGLLATTAAACGEDDEPTATASDIATLVADNPDFDTLEAALDAAGLTATFEGAGPFTVFAPTDAAFAALPAGALDALLADKAALTDVLKYHVVAGKVMAADVVKLTTATTLEGSDLAISVVDGGVVLNGSVKVTATDIAASNGVVHVIDAVLLPPEPEPERNTIADIVAGNPDFETLYTAVGAAGLAEALASPGPFTVFAPTDAAFAALPAGALDGLLANPTALTDVLKYHVVAGEVMAADVVKLTTATTLEGADISIAVVDGGVVLNGSVKVTQTDIMADNGVIHVIDAVLMPPQSIASIAAGDARFSTLVTALDAAGLTAALDGPGPFTVFAPTNDAFAAIPEADLTALLADKDALTDVLLYHVVDGTALAGDVVSKTYVTAKNGAIAPVVVGEAGVTIAGAKVLVTDIRAKNGVIHVIDRVIVPPPTIAELAASNPDLETLYTAVGAAGLGATLDEGGPFTVFAPTDAAFAAVPSATLDGLLADTTALTGVLLYHVVDGVVPASVAVGLTEATTKNGAKVTISYDGTVLDVGGAAVIGADVWARNGVVHVIDKVLLPPAM